MFQQIAADLCGIKLRSRDLQTEAKVVNAQVVEYQQNDPSVQAPYVPGRPDESKPARRCTIQ